MSSSSGAKRTWREDAMGALMDRAAITEGSNRRALLMAVAQMSVADPGVGRVTSALPATDALASRLATQRDIERRRAAMYDSRPWLTNRGNLRAMEEEMRAAFAAEAPGFDAAAWLRFDARLIVYDEGLPENYTYRDLHQHLIETDGLAARTTPLIHVLPRYRIAVVYFPAGYPPAARKRALAALRATHSMTGSTPGAAGVLWTMRGVGAGGAGAGSAAGAGGTCHLFLFQGMPEGMAIQGSGGAGKTKGG